MPAHSNKRKIAMANSSFTQSYTRLYERLGETLSIGQKLACLDFYGIYRMSLPSYIVDEQYRSLDGEAKLSAYLADVESEIKGKHFLQLIDSNYHFNITPWLSNIKIMT
jgi:hypothetical protein